MWCRIYPPVAVVHAGSGDFVWAKSIGKNTNDIGTDVAVDSSGNVYITGSFSGTVDFDPGPGIHNLTSAGSGDIFVSKLDSSGNLVWAKSMGGSLDDSGFGIAVDSSGNVYTTGTFSHIAIFGNYSLTSESGLDVYANKLDSSGNFVWTKHV